MKIFTITYVSFVFKHENGNNIEKTKTYVLSAKDVADATSKFLEKKINHKKIVSVLEDNSNTLANICPELFNLRNSLN